MISCSHLLKSASVNLNRNFPTDTSCPLVNIIGCKDVDSSRRDQPMREMVSGRFNGFWVEEIQESHQAVVKCYQYYQPDFRQLVLQFLLTTYLTDSCLSGTPERQDAQTVELDGCRALGNDVERWFCAVKWSIAYSSYDLNLKFDPF